MILDGLLTFTGTSNGASGGITASAYADLPTTGTQTASNVLDLGMAGLPASISGGGGGGARDIGIGDKPALKISIMITIALTGGTSLQCDISGAPDNGSGAAGTYTVMWTGPAVVEANLVAGQYANIDMPRMIPGQAVPRFIRLRFISVGTHSAGAVEAQIVIDEINQIVGTGGALSGYPAGITISN